MFSVFRSMQNDAYGDYHLPLGRMAAISRRSFQMHFLRIKMFVFYQNFTEVCSRGSDWQYPSIGFDNGLASNRRHNIIWTNADQIYWRIYAPLVGDELINHDAIFLLLLLLKMSISLFKLGHQKRNQIRSWIIHLYYKVATWRYTSVEYMAYLSRIAVRRPISEQHGLFD